MPFFAAYVAAPTVPLKGTWMATLVPTLGPVTTSSGLAPDQTAGAMLSIPVLVEVTG